MQKTARVSQFPFVPDEIPYVTIPLTQGQVAIVDPEDYGLLMRWKWFAAWSPTSHTFYAQTNETGADGIRFTLKMHRVVMRAVEFDIVDHKGHCTLDNRKHNLRLCTKGNNNCNVKMRKDNKHGLKGTTWNKAERRWRAQIQINGKKMLIGRFLTAEEAYEAYCERAIELHKEFAFLGRPGIV